VGIVWVGVEEIGEGATGGGVVGSRCYWPILPFLRGCCAKGFRLKPDTTETTERQQRPRPAGRKDFGCR